MVDRPRAVLCLRECSYEVEEAHSALAGWFVCPRAPPTTFPARSIWPPLPAASSLLFPCSLLVFSIHLPTSAVARRFSSLGGRWHPPTPPTPARRSLGILASPLAGLTLDCLPAVPADTLASGRQESMPYSLAGSDGQGQARSQRHNSTLKKKTCVPKRVPTITVSSASFSSVRRQKGWSRVRRPPFSLNSGALPKPSTLACHRTDTRSVEK